MLDLGYHSGTHSLEYIVLEPSSLWALFQGHEQQQTPALPTRGIS